MSLTRDDVIAGALAILDEYGLADLTMRRLADRLAVQPGALYWHVPNKQTLLAAVADRIESAVAPPPAPAWDTWLTGWAAAVRTVLLSHRDAAELVMSARATGLGGVDVSQPGVDRLIAAGFARPEAEASMQVLLHFVLGHVYEEQTRAQLVQLGVLSEHDPDADRREFGDGVSLVVGGIAARHPR